MLATCYGSTCIANHVAKAMAVGSVVAEDGDVMGTLFSLDDEDGMVFEKEMGKSVVGKSQVDSGGSRDAWAAEMRVMLRLALPVSYCEREEEEIKEEEEKEKEDI